MQQGQHLSSLGHLSEFADAFRKFYAGYPGGAPGGQGGYGQGPPQVRGCCRVQPSVCCLPARACACQCCSRSSVDPSHAFNGEYDFSLRESTSSAGVPAGSSTRRIPSTGDPSCPSTSSLPQFCIHYSEAACREPCALRHRLSARTPWGIAETCARHA